MLPSRSSLGRVSHIVKNAFSSIPIPLPKQRTIVAGRRGGGLFLSTYETEHFLYDSHITWIISEAISSAQYFYSHQTLAIEFKNGSIYAYPNITLGLASSFIAARKKNTWVWDHLRRRVQTNSRGRTVGGRTAHRGGRTPLKVR